MFVAELEVLVAAQAELIAVLRSENAEFKARLGKDSENSSSPPSRDRVDRRVRRATEREARKTARDGEGNPTRRVHPVRRASPARQARRAAPARQAPPGILEPPA